MAVMPESMRLTPDEEEAIQTIRTAAKVRHEAARKAAAKRGRRDFPLLPYECSWAFENEFLSKYRNGLRYNASTRNWQ